MNANDRVCSTCGTPLSGKLHHGFRALNGGLSCGRSETEATVRGKNGVTLAKIKLPCAQAVRWGG